ncbi:hypothetical protein [Deinococcus wulumuqiensis]|uniref:Uncharacterized protein n=1 Tax=Deinococcus wulumuqiensis TaxID=980427 RepID=A0AAV4K6R7_9DEIO|nr:hypothetical protein [Deinococcus wulumuqiensis]QII22480.1 hypothetical protein G6R31_16615 [Deinococcus wulumuqiensis R12]GGI88203.1 hypothetical protein GCM10010914_23240 [Deinococcus wulumuqiensis]GGP30331.1 hypothetical protein GCM10008021_19820 [Deinococcus wulumuqiensis]
MPYKVFDSPGILRDAQSHFPYADEVVAEHKPGSIGHTALMQVLRSPEQAATFSAYAWAYRDAATPFQEREYLGGMQAVCLMLTLNWHFPVSRPRLTRRAMQALYEAATGIETQLPEPDQVMEEPGKTLLF